MFSGGACYLLVKEIPNLDVESGVALFFLKKKILPLGRNIYSVRRIHMPIHVEEYGTTSWPQATLLF